MPKKKKSPAAQFPVSWTVFDGPDGFAAQIVRVTNEGKDNQQTENIALVHHEGNVPLISAALDLLTFASNIRRYLLAGGISEKSDVEFVLDAANAVIRKASPDRREKASPERSEKAEGGSK